MPVYVYKEDVAKEASRLRGAAGPCGVDGLLLKSCCLRYKIFSELLRAELARWADCMSNGSPAYASYHALNASRMLAADKQPGIHPLACGDILMRLLARCNIAQTKGPATVECANVQLSGGLRASIEGNLHAVRAAWPQSAGWTVDFGPTPESDVIVAAGQIGRASCRERV